jgi:hypothetical protein
MNWMLTVDELREQNIKGMAEAGAKFSRHCRNCWTGERIRTSLNVSEFTGRRKYLHMIISLPVGGPLLDYSNTADLDTYYTGKANQHTWSVERWEREIRERMR